MGKETRSMWLILFLLGELRMFEAPTFWVFFSQESHSQRDWLGEGGGGFLTNKKMIADFLYSKLV